jgi:hypothetical protein
MWRDQLKARALGVTDSIVATIIVAVAVYGSTALIAWYSAHAFLLAGFAPHWAVIIGVGVFLAVAAGLNLISLVIVRHRRRGMEAPGFSETAAASNLRGAPPEAQTEPKADESSNRIQALERELAELSALKSRYEWLRNIAEEDRKDISKAAFVILKDVSNRLADSIPRIYFTFTVFNGSVYSLSIDPSVEGEIRCRKTSIMGAMKVHGFKDLPHGSAGNFTLTFEPTAAGANFILEAQRSGEDWFWFDQLKIKVVAGGGKEIEPKRLNLPEDVYSTNTRDRIQALKARHESEKDEWRKRARNVETLSVVLGMGEELMRTYRLSSRVPPEHIEEWRRRLQSALRRCYGEGGLAKFYPFPYEGTVLEGPKPVYPQERWFDEHMERLKQLIAAEYDGPATG